MKILPVNYAVPRNVPHLRLKRGVIVPNQFADHNPLPLGDWVAAVTRVTGIARAVRVITGGKCGCGKRQEDWNQFGAKVAGAIKGKAAIV